MKQDCLFVFHSFAKTFVWKISHDASIDRKSTNRQIMLARTKGVRERAREKKEVFFSLLTLNQLFWFKWMSFVHIQCVHNSLQRWWNGKLKASSVYLYLFFRIHSVIHISRILIFHFVKLTYRVKVNKDRIENKQSIFTAMHTKLNLRHAFKWHYSIVCCTEQKETLTYTTHVEKVSNWINEWMMIENVAIKCVCVALEIAPFTKQVYVTYWKGPNRNCTHLSNISCK